MANRPTTAPSTATSGSRRVGRSNAPVTVARRRLGGRIVRSQLTRQVAMLGLALCAVALSVAYPVRNYLSQRAQETAVVAQQHELERQIGDLQARKTALQDPAYIKAEAKRRLQYVSPGDTVYVVKAPPLPTSSAGAAPESSAVQAPAAEREPWYASMWDTLQNGAPAGRK